MGISVRTTDGGAELELRDDVERRRLTVGASPAVEPTPTDDPFRFPVDEAVAVETRRLTVPEVPAGLLRDGDGDQLAELVPGTDRTFSQGTYVVELDGPMKVYVRLEGAPSVTVTVNRLEVALDAVGEVAVGARSFHQRPAATVTTTGEPADLLAAVSTFASALKTTSCERSYPTLRGHPPTLEVGDERHVPASLSTPETGVRLELPAERRYAFAAAPLAYYLGADLVPASRPRLVTETGLERSLDADDGFAAEAGRLLRHVFFLDCLTRTEGHYDVPLRERAATEPVVDLSFENLYGRPLAEQLEAYLSVPHADLEPHLPRWPLAADVPTTAERATVLPYLVDDLALVRPAEGERLAAPEVRRRVLSQVWDDGGSMRASTAPGDGEGVDGEDEPDRPAVVAPRDSDALAQAWFGPGVPVDASKGVEAAYRNRLAGAAEADDAGVTVVCNGDVGSEERAVESIYGDRDVGFEVTLRRDVTTAELADILESDVDFLHYVGHVDAAGFGCPDGHLDAASLDGVGVRAFLLNACRSYRQGLALVEGGAVGGVATFADVADAGAVRVGRAMARLLNRGFPLRAAYTVAGGESVVGGNYLVVGDGTVEVVRPRHGAPVLCDVRAVDGDDADYELTVRASLPSGVGVGALALPYVRDNETYYLPPGRLDSFRLSAAELREYLAWFDDPVRRDGELYWPDGPDVPEGLFTARR